MKLSLNDNQGNRFRNLSRRDCLSRATARSPLKMSTLAHFPGVPKQADRSLQLTSGPMKFFAGAAARSPLRKSTLALSPGVPNPLAVIGPSPYADTGALYNDFDWEITEK